MGLIKLLHVSCAGASICGFIARGILMMQDSPLLKARWIKIIPHVVDAVLFTTAIVMAVQLGLSPATTPWLMAKIIALLIYIGLGVVALRPGHTRLVRISAWFVAVLVFFYIVAVAVTKTPFIITPGL